MFPWYQAAGLGAGILGGFLDGEDEYELSPEQQWSFNFLKRLAKQELQWGQSPAGSDPQERLALAQAVGVAGQGAGAGFEQLLAQMGTGAQGGTTGSADAIARFGQSAQGDRANISTQMLMQFLQARRAARGNAAGYASAAGGMAPPPTRSQGSDLAGIFGALGQAAGYAYGQRNSGSRTRNPTAPPDGGFGGDNASRPMETASGASFNVPQFGNQFYDPERFGSQLPSFKPFKSGVY